MDRWGGWGMERATFFMHTLGFWPTPLFNYQINFFIKKEHEFIAKENKTIQALPHLIMLPLIFQNLLGQFGQSLLLLVPDSCPTPPVVGTPCQWQGGRWGTAKRHIFCYGLSFDFNPFPACWIRDGWAGTPYSELNERTTAWPGLVSMPCEGWPGAR